MTSDATAAPAPKSTIRRRFLQAVFVIVALVAAVVVFDFVAPQPAARLAVGMERWRAGLEEKRTSIPGFELVYLEGGHAAKPGEAVVLLHGFGAN